VEKIKVKVYVNQGKSLSHIKIRHAYDFSLCFSHELLMSFLIINNNMHGFSCNLKKHKLVSFSKTSILIVFEKLTRACFSKPYYILPILILIFFRTTCLSILFCV
jgi:uncharacterized protein YrrD